MEDETLNNVLNILQNVSNSNTNTNNTNNTNNNLFSNNNNDIQTLLIKLLLSGGLNQIINSRNQNTQEKPEPPKSEKPRTIDLTNYQRLD